MIFFGGVKPPKCSGPARRLPTEAPGTDLKADTRLAHTSCSEHACVVRVNDPQFVLHRLWDFRFQILSVSRSRHGCASQEALVTDTRETENVRFLARQAPGPVRRGSG